MSRSSKIELLYFCVLIESLAGYAYDEKHNGRHTDGKHDDLYPHGTKHAKHDKDATFAYQIVETDRTFTYDAAGKLVSATETEDNYGTYIYTYEYDLMGNRTYMEKTLNGTVAEWHKYEYNESNQLVSEQLYNGKKTTSLAYTYDADGNRITETGKVGTDKVEKTYEYTVENRLAAVHDGDELLLAAAYDGDGNRVFLLNYNLHTDDDWKGNSGNATGTTRTIPAAETTEKEIPAITAMETATVRGRATIRRTASPGARMTPAMAMQPMRRRTTARTSAAFSSRYRRKSALQRQI